MSTSTEPQDKAKRNQQAIASLVLGVLSIVFALTANCPGIFSVPACVAPVAVLLAFVAGVRGIRAARELGQGRKLAIAGMALGGLGLLVFIVLFLPSFLEPQRELARASATFEAAQTLLPGSLLHKILPTLSLSPIVTRPAKPPCVESAQPSSHSATTTPVPFKL